MRFIPLASSSRGNAYLLQTEGIQPLLLEAGLPIKQLRDKLREHGVGLSDLAGCLVSHEHGDHSKAVKDLLRIGIDCWLSEKTSEALGILSHHRTHHNFESLKIAGYSIIMFDLEHDAADPKGFFIAQGDERLLFVADTGYVKDRFSGITIVTVECNFQDEILHENISDGYLPSIVGRRTRRHHMSLKTVKDFILSNDLSKCREIHLLHLSDVNSDEVRMKKEVQKLTGIPVYIANR